jgi:protein-tyrosine-phosphatase
MKNIIEILKALGIEITDENVTAITKEVAENYKTIAEHDKTKTKLANALSELEVANSTLKNFEGIDTDKITGELESYKTKLAELEDTHKKELYTRDFEDVLTKSIEKYKFSSELAKEAIINKIR